MDLAQQALGRAGVGRDTGNDGAGQVDNGTLNQVEDNIDGAAEDGEGEETVGADEGVDELGVGLNESVESVVDGQLVSLAEGGNHRSGDDAAGVGDKVSSQSVEAADDVRELLGKCNRSNVADGIAGGGKHVGDAVQGRGDASGVKSQETDIELVELSHLLNVDVVSELLELVDLLALLALLHSLALLGGRHGVGRLDRQSGGEDGDELELHFGGLMLEL